MGARKRIGVLTFHHITNEGAILQAYCLANRLAKEFKEHDVEIIDLQSASAEWAYFKLALMSSRNPRVIIQKVDRYFRLKSFIAKSLPLSQKRMVTDSIEKSVHFLGQTYDTIVVGSDEIWKVEKGSVLRPFPNIYWLDSGLSCKKIAYAASANKLAYKDLEFSNVDWMKSRLNEFDLLGVRDDHTMDFVKYLRINHPERLNKVPDPTLIWNVPEIDLRDRLARYGVDFKRKRVAMTFADPAVVAGLADYFRKQDYQVIGLTAVNPYADINLAGKLNPFEWANSFRFFNFSCTNLFHGTIFSLKAKIPFLSFDYFNGPQYDTKMHCLLNEFGLLAHYVPAKNVSCDLSILKERVEQIQKGFDADVIVRVLQERDNVAKHFFEKIREIIK